MKFVNRNLYLQIDYFFKIKAIIKIIQGRKLKIQKVYVSEMLILVLIEYEKLKSERILILIN